MNLNDIVLLRCLAIIGLIVVPLSIAALIIGYIKVRRGTLGWGWYCGSVVAGIVMCLTLSFIGYPATKNIDVCGIPYPIVVFDVHGGDGVEYTSSFTVITMLINMVMWLGVPSLVLLLLCYTCGVGRRCSAAKGASDIVE
jgi:hypothetical protein